MSEGTLYASAGIAGGFWEEGRLMAAYEPLARRPIATAFRQTAQGTVRLCVWLGIHPGKESAIRIAQELQDAVLALGPGTTIGSAATAEEV